jgi:TolB protein
MNLILNFLLTVFSKLPRPRQLMLSGAAIMLLGYSLPGSAVLTIEVNKGQVAGIPIAIVPFSMQGVSPSEQQPADIISADLGFSGRFDTIPPTSYLSSPHDLKSVKFKDWRLIKSEALVVGKVINIGNAQYEVRFRLIDVFREKQLVGQKFVVPASKLRKVSHQISDIIYQKLTGKVGAFDTKIAYVTIEGDEPSRRYLLQVADADGWGPKTILESTQPILSPAWSPDGSRLAYVSFEKKRSMVFVQDIWTGKRNRIAEFQGINSAPAWSPDGRKLALTLSKDGNAEIYLYDLATSNLRRLTQHTAIDTEPSWSPDGGKILFTSGRSGGAQLYQMSAAGGPPQRVTFSGSYNAGGSYSPDGRSIVLITNQGNGYKVGIYSTRDRSIRELTRSHQDESPSFAPNGDMIMYATQRGGRNVLATVSADGQVQQTLKFQGGSVREPAWSPFNRKL